MDNDALLLTDAEAARLLRMLRSRLVRMARRGDVPCIILPDGDVRFRRGDLAEWIGRHHRPAAHEGVAR